MADLKERGKEGVTALVGGAIDRGITYAGDRGNIRLPNLLQKPEEFFTGFFDQIEGDYGPGQAFDNTSAYLRAFARSVAKISENLDHANVGPAYITGRTRIEAFLRRHTQEPADTAATGTATAQTDRGNHNTLAEIGANLLRVWEGIPPRTYGSAADLVIPFEAHLIREAKSRADHRLLHDTAALEEFTGNQFKLIGNPMLGCGNTYDISDVAQSRLRDIQGLAVRAKMGAEFATAFYDTCLDAAREQLTDPSTQAEPRQTDLIRNLVGQLYDANERVITQRDLTIVTRDPDAFADFLQKPLYPFQLKRILIRIVGFVFKGEEGV